MPEHTFFKYIAEVHLILIHYRSIPYPKKVSRFTLYKYISEVYPILVNWSKHYRGSAETPTPYFSILTHVLT